MALIRCIRILNHIASLVKNKNEKTDFSREVEVTDAINRLAVIDRGKKYQRINIGIASGVALALVFSTLFSSNSGTAIAIMLSVFITANIMSLIWLLIGSFANHLNDKVVSLHSFKPTLYDINFDKREDGKRVIQGSIHAKNEEEAEIIGDILANINPDSYGSAEDFQTDVQKKIKEALEANKK